MVTTRSSRLPTGKGKKLESEKPSSSTRRNMKQDPDQPSSSSTRRNIIQDPNQPSSSSTNQVVGMRFSPTDHELVDHYLQTRIQLGDHFESDFVLECLDFYGENEPWEVWHEYGGDESKKVDTLYFFTHRRRTSPTSTRFDRKVGSGTWSGQNWKPVVHEEDESVVIGTKREFRYEGGRNKAHNDAWLMQEYQIDDDCDTVLCTLRKSRRNPPPAQSSSVDQKTKLNLKKRKAAVYQPKPKRQKKQEIYDEEQDASSGDEQTLEPQGPSVDQPKMEPISFELDQGHPMLQVVMPYGDLHDDQDCYYPELPVEYCCDDNNLNLVSSVGQVAQFEEDSTYMDLLLNA